MFIYIRMKERKIRRFATGEMVGKVVGMVTVSLDRRESLTLAEACELSGLKRLTDTEWATSGGEIVSADTAELSNS